MSLTTDTFQLQHDLTVAIPILMNSVLINPVVMIPALMILGWGVLFWVPSVRSHYGCAFFGEAMTSRTHLLLKSNFGPARFGTSKMLSVCMLMLLALVLVGATRVSMQSVLVSSASALFLVSLWGVVCLDLKWRVIPDRFHATGLVAALTLLATSGQTAQELVVHVAAGLSLPIILSGVTWGWERWRGEGAMGWGDVKLLVWLGIWAGPRALDGFLFACFLALLFVVLRNLWSTCITFARSLGPVPQPQGDGDLKAVLREPFAFGPALVLGFPLVIFAGQFLS
jgi:Flp pilus assembly protein protease CpaA